MKRSLLSDREVVCRHGTQLATKHNSLGFNNTCSIKLFGAAAAALKSQREEYINVTIYWAAIYSYTAGRVKEKRLIHHINHPPPLNPQLSILFVSNQVNSDNKNITTILVSCVVCHRLRRYTYDHYFPLLLPLFFADVVRIDWSTFLSSDSEFLCTLECDTFSMQYVSSI